MRHLTLTWCAVVGALFAHAGDDWGTPDDHLGLEVSSASAQELMARSTAFARDRGYVHGAHCATAECVGSAIAESLCASHTAVACDPRLLCGGESALVGGPCCLLGDPCFRYHIFAAPWRAEWMGCGLDTALSREGPSYYQRTPSTLL